MDLLGASESEDEDAPQLKINSNYADRYNKWREKEVMQKLKDKHGEQSFKSDKKDGDTQDSDGSESESESESEDSDAEEMTPELEKDFFKTLASLKAKDPKIYDSSTSFFKSSDGRPTKTKEKAKNDKITLGDMERKVMLEKEGKYDELDEGTSRPAYSQTYVEEMRELKADLKKAVHEDNSDDDDPSDEDDLLLKPRQKTQVEKEKEEEEYKQWLAGQKSEISDPSLAEEMKGLKSFWSHKELDEGEQFLKDFLLKKRYLEEESKDFVPTYLQVVHDSDEGLSEDERNVEKQEEFEHKFNFRYEEPDEEFIKRYPRTIKDSMRKPNEKRKKKRKEVEERKKAEKQQKKEELKMLKSMKKKEILEKLDKLKKITGNEDMALKDEDIEGDFDPEAYDRRMKELFENYDDTGAVDEEKPTFSDLDDDDDYEEDEYTAEDWENWTGPGSLEEGDGAHCEDPNFVMDCDYIEQSSSQKNQQEMIENSKGRKKSRKRSKFAEALERNKTKPVFDPNDKSFQEYVDEYYKLDCEDVIGDMPCRFKYRNVEANDFGLSAEEVLGADDRELNAWVSLRKTCQYRNQDEEKRDLHVFRSKAKNFELKRKVLPSLFKEPDEEEDKEESAAKKKRKKNKKRKREAESAEPTLQPSDDPAKKRKDDINLSQNGAKNNKSPHENNSSANNANKKKKKKNKQANGGPKTANDNGNNNNNKNPAENPDLSRTGQNGKKFKNNNKMKNNNKFNKKNKKEVKEEDKFSNDRLKAYGLNPSKYKRMIKKQKFRDKEAAGKH